MTLHWNSKRLRRNLGELPIKVDRAVKANFEYSSAVAESSAKTNASWTDQTSAARNGLHSRVYFGREHYELILAHAVHYGIWLEVANSGKYAIIMKTLRLVGDDLMQRLDRLFAEMR